MPNVIDTKIVEMKFDNAEFERNVKQTMDSLQALNKQVDNTDNTSGMTGLLKVTESLTTKFSALEIAGITAITRISNAAISAGEKMIKSLSVDNIAAGFEKFGEKTRSVQTLVAQGYALELVNDQLERLNWFTDETSYNFTDMVGNIAKFTATGAGLEESVTAMEGIALWAAMSGQNAQKASMAMYQLSQAMSKGVLKYDDWKSISNASMDTAEFRKKAAEAAVALGQLKDAGNGMYQTLSGKILKLNELFSADYMSREAWFSKDVMMKVFSEYSEAVDKVYNYAEEHGVTASQAIEALGDEVSEFGLKAFKAGQEARTFSDVIDSVKDAVSTGWMNTFEKIFGDADEATKLWTGLANALWEVFASGGEARNELLQMWKDMNGRYFMIEGIANVFKFLTQVVGTFKDAIGQVFPPATAEMLTSLSRSFFLLTKKMKLTEEQMIVLRNIFAILLIPIRLFTIALQTGLKVAGAFGLAIVKLIAWFLQLAVNVAKAGGPLKAIFGDKRYSKMATAFGKIIDTISKGFGGLKDSAEDFLKTDFGNGLKTIAGAFIYLKEKALDAVANGIDKLASSKIPQIFTAGVLTIVKGLAIALGAVVLAFNKLVTGIGKLKNTKIVTLITTGLKKLFDIGKDLFELVMTFFERLTRNIPFLNDTVYAIESLSEATGHLSDENGKGISFTDGLIQGLTYLKGKIKEFLGTLSEFMDGVDWGRIILAAFVLSFVMLIAKVAELAGKLSMLTSSLNTTLTLFQDMFLNPLNTKASAFKSIALGISLIAASLAALTLVNTKKLAIVTVILGAFVGLFYGLSVAIAKWVGTSKEMFKFAAILNSLGKYFMSTSIGILALAAALKVLSTVETKNIWTYAAVLVSLATAIGVIGVALAKWAPELTKGAIFLIGFAASVWILAKALKGIQSIGLDGDQLAPLVGTLLGFMAAVAVLSTVASKVGLGAAASILALVFALKLVVNGLMSLADEENAAKLQNGIKRLVSAIMSGIDTFWDIVRAHPIKAILTLVVTFGALLVFASLVDAVGTSLAQSALSIAAAFGLFSVSVSIMLMAIGKFGQVFETLGYVGEAATDKAMAFILEMGVVFAAILFASQYASEVAKSVAKSFAMFGIGVGVLVASIYMLGKIPEDVLTQGLGMLIVLEVIVGIFLVLTRTANTIDWKVLMAFSASMLAFVASLAIMEFFTEDTMKTLDHALILGLGLVAVAGSLWIASQAAEKVKLAPLIAMISAIGVITAAFVILDKFNTTSLLDKAIALGGVMMALSAALYVAGTSGDSSKTMGAGAGLLLAAAGLVAVAQAFKMVETIDGAKLIETAEAFAIVLATLTLGVAILSAFKSVALIGAAAILIVSAAMLILGAALLLMAPAFVVLEIIDYQKIFDGFNQLSKVIPILSIAGLLLPATAIALGLIAVELWGLTKIDMSSIASNFTLLSIAIKSFQGLNIGQLAIVLGLLAVSILALGAASMTLAPAVVVLTGFATALTALIGAVSKFATTMVMTTSKMVNGVAIAASKIKSLFDDMVSAIKAGAVTASNWMAKAGDMMAGAKNTGKGLLGALATKLGWHSPPQFILDLFGDIGTAVGIGGNNALGMFENVGSMLGNGLGSSMSESVMDWVNSIMGSLSGLGGSLKVSTKQMAVAQAHAKGTKMSLQQLEHEFDVLGDQAFAKKYGLDMKQLGVETEKTTDAMDEFADATTSAGSAASGAGSAVSKAKDEFQEFGETVYNALSNQLDYFGKFDNEQSMSSQELLDNMKSQIDGYASWAHRLNVVLARGLDRGIYQQLAEMGPQSYKYVSAFFEMTDAQIQEANQLFATENILPTEMTTQLMGAFTLAGSNAGLGFNQGMVNQLTTVGTTARSVGEKALAELMLSLDEHSPSKKTFVIGQYFDMGIDNGIKFFEPYIFNTIFALGYLMLFKLKAQINYSNGYSIGENLMQGLIDGINAKGAEAIEAASAIAAAVIEIMKVTNFDEHSPSKVTDWMGKYLMIGLANGMWSKAQDVYDSANSVSQMALNSIRSTLSHVPDILDDEMDINPVITPVLDLSNLKTNAGIVHGLLASNSTYQASVASSKLAYKKDNQNGGNSSNNGSGVTTMSFTQNNYSPKALNRIEIYRQTKNQVNTIKKVVNNA